MFDQGTVLWAARWIMGIVGGALASRGIGDAELWTSVTGAVLGGVPVVWSYIERQRLQAAAK